MSTIRFQLHSIQFKKKNTFETYFPYYTIFSLIIGFHVGRHLGYIEMLNDARVASLGFFKYNVLVLQQTHHIVTHTGPHRVTSSNIYQIKAKSLPNQKMHDATSVCQGVNFYESLKRAPIQINNFTNKISFNLRSKTLLKLV